MRITKAITKYLAGAALAGALLFAAPHKADAQFAVGVRIGVPVAPVVVAPGPVYPYGYYRPYYGYGAYYRPYGYAPRPYAYYRGGYRGPVYRGYRR